MFPPKYPDSPTPPPAHTHAPADPAPVRRSLPAVSPSAPSATHAPNGAASNRTPHQRNECLHRRQHGAADRLPARLSAEGRLMANKKGRLGASGRSGSFRPAAGRSATATRRQASCVRPRGRTRPRRMLRPLSRTSSPTSRVGSGRTRTPGRWTSSSTQPHGCGTGISPTAHESGTNRWCGCTSCLPSGPDRWPT